MTTSSISLSSTALALRLCLSSWRRQPRRATVNAISSHLSCHSFYLASQPSSQRKAFSSQLYLAGLALIGTFMGLTAIGADWSIHYGNPHLAAKLFPWNRYIRTAPGYDAARHNGMTSAILEALRDDPNSADLTLNAAALEARDGNIALAEMYIGRFKALAPNSNINPSLHKKEK
jgi:hypothetical protein